MRLSNPVDGPVGHPELEAATEWVAVDATADPAAEDSEPNWLFLAIAIPLAAILIAAAGCALLWFTFHKIMGVLSAEPDETDA